MSLVGRTLSHYEIVEEISRGGMGVVYRARDTRLNRDVALKVLPPALVSDPARRERFVQEARAASALEHPHIGVIHAIDEVDGVSFIAMELIRGEKLSDVLARGPLTPPRALELAVEIAEGLARAHDKGVVHRDLKPANVMLTEDGHAKIIDFGLAKLVDALSGDSGGQTVLKAETDPGMVLGTVTYMSPEQARGAKVDSRSDVFSFGIVLHEMLTGRPPFRGHTGIDTMHAILHDPVPALPALGGTVTGDLQRVLDKCLAKDPDERYQGMRDVVVDLRAARRRLDSAAHATAAGAVERTMGSPQGLMRARTWLYAAAAVIVLALAGFGALRGRWTGAPSAAPVVSSNEKPSVAVLYFENNTGNPQLDWLRTGLTDMLVTDLSQSPDLEVLPTDRLVQILGDLKHQDDRTISFDTVQQIARRAGVKTVALGSYVKAGDTIRINLKLQDPFSGKLVTSERVEAAGESNLFPTVDDLTKRIKAKFASNIDPTQPLLRAPTTITTTTGTSIDRDLKDVTTASIEAYRYYAEGISLHERFREQAAIAPLEKAVEIDPNFAMAMTKLAVVHSNLGHANLREEYAKRALDHADRLTLRERYYVEAYSYATHSETVGRAIEAYNKALELYPDHASSRNNVGLIYFLLERFDDAIREFEELRRRHNPFTGTHGNLSAAYAGKGEIDKAVEVMREFVSDNPENAAGYNFLGFALSIGNRFDEARAAFRQTTALAPGDLTSENGRRAIDVLQEKWSDAEAADQHLARSDDPAFRIYSGVNLAIDALYHGRLEAALKRLEQTAAGDGARGSNLSASARNFLAAALLNTSQPAPALAAAERALADARNQGAEWQSLFLIGRAQARLGRQQDAARTADDLARRAAALPSDREKRRVRTLTGVMALDRGDARAAIGELVEAEKTLTANAVGGANMQQSQHVQIWFALGSAQLLAGNPAEAERRFQKIVESGRTRLNYPIEFVRSLYYLGQINERRGDRAKAGEYYRRFVQYWGDGDIDRDRVADARSKITS
jgi:eukaryotic-like serine/threonine-protein kinase